jgi:hypothetical protein
MAKVIFGNHSSVLVPWQDRHSIRQFYCDVLGGKIMKEDPARHFVRLGDDFYIGFLCGDVTDEREFIPSFKTDFNNKGQIGGQCLPGIGVGGYQLGVS